MQLAALALVVFGCVNVTQETIDESVRNLKIASAALDAEEYDKARKWLGPIVAYLVDMRGSIDPKDGKVKMPDGTVAPTPDPGFLRRIARVRSLVRSRDPKGKQADRDEGLAMFEKEALGPAPDPTALADYAELMSRVSTRAPQALMMLRQLDSKDLVGSAHAYEALARLEKARGNADAEAAARAKCKTRTKLPAICG